MLIAAKYFFRHEYNCCLLETLCCNRPARTRRVFFFFLSFLFHAYLYFFLGSAETLVENTKEKYSYCFDGESTCSAPFWIPTFPSALLIENGGPHLTNPAQWVWYDDCCPQPPQFKHKVQNCAVTIQFKKHKRITISNVVGWHFAAGLVFYIYETARVKNKNNSIINCGDIPDGIWLLLFHLRFRPHRLWLVHVWKRYICND